MCEKEKLLNQRSKLVKGAFLCQITDLCSLFRTRFGNVVERSPPIAPWMQRPPRQPPRSVLSASQRLSASVLHSREKQYGDDATGPTARGSVLSHKRDVSPSRSDHETREQRPW